MSVNASSNQLESIAADRKIQIHEPFAEFLKADRVMYRFEISLLPCHVGCEQHLGAYGYCAIE